MWEAYLKQDSKEGHWWEIKWAETRKLASIHLRTWGKDISGKQTAGEMVLTWEQHRVAEVKKVGKEEVVWVCEDRLRT